MTNSLHIHVEKEPLAYDGTQLRPHWALSRFRLQGDSIISFRGPCRVDLTHMVDLQDVLNQDPIFSPDMLHFIIEHFDVDLARTVLRQRMLVVVIHETLAERVPGLIRRGDDLFVDGRKLSVSIATISPVSTLIHTGLNVFTDGVPVPAIGLAELGWSDDNVFPLATRIAQHYADEMSSVNLARCKVRGVNWDGSPTR